MGFNSAFKGVGVMDMSDENALLAGNSTGG
jgi:hypothetical protein